MEFYNIKKIHAMAVKSGNLSLSDVNEGIRDDVQVIYDQLIKEESEVEENGDGSTNV